MREYIFKNKLLFILNIIFVMFNSILNIFLALVLGDVVNAAVNANMVTLTRSAIECLIYIIVFCLIRILSKYLRIKFIKKVMFEMKNDVFKNILKSPINVFNKNNSSNYISIINNDMAILENDYFNNIYDIIDCVLSFILATIFILRINVYVALALYLISGFMLIIPKISSAKIAKLKKNYSDSLSQLTVQTNDFLNGFEIIKSFNIEKSANNQFSNYNNDVESSKFKFSMFSSIVNLISATIGLSSIFICMLISSYLVIKQSVNVGQMIIIIQLMGNVTTPLLEISYKINTFKSIKLIQNKIENLIENDIELKGLEKMSFDEKIEFRDLTFKYNEEKEILKNISFDIRKGEKIAIVGKSGSGKSTILKLLLKYYDEYDGKILIDGVDIKEIDNLSIFKLISIIHQNIFMFDKSIKDNIFLEDKFSEDKFINVLKLSGIDYFISLLKDKEESLVGQNGCKLSGGEKQRICIARALIRDTPILVLDEATSSLDKETARNIENSILDIEDLTSIIITHNYNSEILKRFNKIILLKDSTIEELTIEELNKMDIV